MKLYISFSFLSFFFCLNAFSQNIYDVGKIPESLKQDAVAIVRNEEQVYDYKTIGTGSIKYKIAITILSKAGDDVAEFAEVYDRFSSIYNIKASIYDASGKKIKDYKSTDFKDQSLISDYTMFQDDRIKLLKFTNNNYPYTIEYSYVQDYNGILSLPSWRSLKGYNISTEKSTYSFQRNNNLNIRLLTSKELNTDSTTANNKTTYTWTASNVPAFVKEPLSVGLDQISAWVRIAPNQFEFDSSKGDLSSWKNLGSWISKLNENGDVLPPVTKTMVQNLIKDAKTDKEKMQILYSHLQQNTRYVSVQLGIGGFKPILAEKVAQVNYGDCKALSNYMKALLKEAGIKSNLIVIGSGIPELNRSFSSMGQANHMILAVPFAKDTTFLECTSQNYPMGYIGYDNSNRNVLMVTENGGQLVRTPKYRSADNYQVRKANIQLLDDGLATIIIKSNYGSAQYEDNLSNLLAEPAEVRKRALQHLDFADAELQQIRFEQADKTLPIINAEITYKTKQLLSKGADKFFLTVNNINRKESVPEKITNRKTDFAISFDYSDEDEIVYTLPKGFSIEFLPKDVKLSSEFGEYSASFSMTENTITYKRTQVMSSKVFPAAKYNEYVDFYKKIYQTDKLKAVLTKI
ncbi:DUF3857 domain-containing protein [Pedobacter sp. ASV28]|uniref:DUF3857 domain-containing protein n=1 Tax=Pedobacter sp. ASV28 TaxID=2795123 RepID=UPI0018EC4B69|nr:DUF3857 domain-containing protein [Pedobacter sp. ASV28]